MPILIAELPKDGVGSQFKKVNLGVPTLFQMLRTMSHSGGKHAPILE